MKAVILAGGLGTRLAGITGDLPKPMAPVGHEPFLAHILDYLIGQGVESVVLAVSYGREVIQSHFGSSYRGLPLDYSIETQPLGTGGAMRQAVSGLGGNVVVLNGDTLFRIELRDMLDRHSEQNARLSMALKQVDDTGRFGAVDITPDGRVCGFTEKAGQGPGRINGGVYILSDQLFDDYPLPTAFSFEKDLVEVHVDDLQPLAYCSDAYFIDMGIPEDYQRACNELGGQ